MARCALCILLVIASVVCYQIDVERGGPSQLRPAPLGSGAPALSRPPTASVVSDARAKVGKWLRAYQGFVAGAAKVSQLISFVCGVWLLFSSPFAIVFSLMTARVPDAILCGFLGVFGVMLSLLELPIGAVQRVLQQYFFFAYTRPGRAALVVLIATIAWACAKVRPHVRLPSILRPASGPTWSHALMTMASPASLWQVGFMTKALIGFNALLTFYILNSQSRRFANVDADAKAALSQASADLRSKAGEALGFTRMFGTAFGLSGAPAQPARPAAPPSTDSFGGFDSSTPVPDGSAQQPTWPGSSSSGSGA
jgi:hypothetical protein